MTYEEYIEKFATDFDEGMKKVKEKYGYDDNFGFIFLFIRESHPESIDFASNLKTEFAIEVLEKWLEKMRDPR